MNKITFEQFDELLQFGGAFSDLGETQRITKVGFLYSFLAKDGEWKDSTPGNSVTITYQDYAEACRKADDDMHTTDVSRTFFESVCKHLGLNKSAQ